MRLAGECGSQDAWARPDRPAAGAQGPLTLTSFSRASFVAPWNFHELDQRARGRRRVGWLRDMQSKTATRRRGARSLHFPPARHPPVCCLRGVRRCAASARIGGGSLMLSLTLELLCPRLPCRGCACVCLPGEPVQTTEAPGFYGAVADKEVKRACGRACPMRALQTSKLRVAVRELPPWIRPFTGGGPCSCSPSAQVLAPHSVNGTSPSQRRVRRVAMLLATLVVNDDV